MKTTTQPKRHFPTSERIYQLLLLTYPSKFRRAHGAELLQIFRTSLRAENLQRGKAGVVRLWLLTIFDVVVNALALHFYGFLAVWRSRQRDIAQASEHTKGKRTFGEMIESIWQDLRYGVRTLARTPSFTALAVLALALGISANSIIFSVVNTVLLRPLPYQDAERLALIWTRFEPELPECGVSGPEVIDFRERSKSFESIAALEWRTFGLTGSGEPEQLQGAVVSPNIFSLLGITPALGRSFLPQEGPSSEGRAVVLSHGLWQRRFGSAPNLVGQSILLDGQAHTVIGVMPAEFALLPPTRNSPNRIDLWVRQPVEYQRLSRGNHALYVMARLKPGVTLEQAQVDMNAVATQLNNEFYSWGGRGTFTFGITVESYHQRMVGHLRRLLYVLLGAVGFVLLIACVNVANLLLAKAVAREREIAVRAALGASRWRIIRQLLTESSVLALCSGAAGLVFTDLGLQALSKLAPDSVPRLAEVTIDGRVFGFTLAISFLTGLVFGLVPAFQAAKLSLNESLKEGGHSASGGLRGRRVRSALVVVEVALALVLMTGAGLMLRSFARLQQVDRGFNPNQLLTAQLQLPRAKYPGGSNVAAFYQQLEERVRALPGIESVGMVSGLPLGSFYDNSTIAVENPQQNQRIGTLQGDVRASSPDYFKTLRIPLLEGRVFTDHDSADSPKVVIIDDVFAKRFFANVDPIGKRVNLMADLHAGKPWASIVGVVSHVKDTIDARETGQLYIPQTQQPSPTMFLAVRAVGEPSALINAVRNAVWALDPEQPVSNIRTMAERVGNSVAQPRLNTLLLALFAAVALILASIGIYGVMNYAVTQRTHEIGVRMALGAQVTDIIKLVVGQGLLLIVVGVLAGLAAAFALTRVMTTLLFDVSATDPLTFAGVSIVLVMVALLASFVPARKATKVDPMSAMRYE